MLLAASGLVNALCAATELVIHEVDKRHRLQRSVHADRHAGYAEFLNLGQREVFSGFELQDRGWGQELGSGCIDGAPSPTHSARTPRFWLWLTNAL